MLDFSSWPRIVIELGMGDGRLIESLASRDVHTLYVGIELDNKQCDQARARISLTNLVILSGSVEDIVPTLYDNSVDHFISILPDPEFIDEKKHDRWKVFYTTLSSKLKRGGIFELVTELTDELLQPVDEAEYGRWVTWLGECFLSIGFIPKSQRDGSPTQYSSRCLDQFRGDNARIRMVTFEFEKR